MTAKSIPEGYHSLTPNLTVDNGLEALTFYENGFGADVLHKHVIGSKLMHAESGRLASTSRGMKLLFEGSGGVRRRA